MEQLQERIDRGEVVILDGATGTELERRGVPMHGVSWSAAALETHPDVVRAGPRGLHPRSGGYHHHQHLLDPQRRLGADLGKPGQSEGVPEPASGRAAPR